MAVFERKIWKDMVYWKDNLSTDHSLLIEGARRVGKTTIVKKFAEDFYKSSIIVDFSKPRDGILELFEKGAGDLDRFFLHLQRIMKTELVTGESVIVLDEIQLCPPARQMIKHLVADGRYRYIETGSQISLRQNVRNILVPSEEHRIRMYPMDFEEFLWANGDRITMDVVRDAYLKSTPMGRYAHDAAMEMFRLYMLVGGMPKVVTTFLEKNSFEMVEQEKRGILELYREDLGKIKNDHTGKCKRIFNSIPGLLTRHDKSFKANAVRRYSRTEDYLDAINSLDESRTVNVCRKCDDPDPAMDMYEDEMGFKLYMADTGLLFTAAFESNIGDRDEIYSLILKDKLSVNQGMFFENVVAQELRSSGRELLYSRFKTKDTVNTQEVDFIMASGSRIIPLEVKSSASNRHVSLDRFIEKYSKRVKQAYVIHTKDLRVDGMITYVPAYMISLIGSKN